MDFKAYLKREIEKTMFIEINKDVQLNLKGNPILKRGEYPLLPGDIVNLAKMSQEAIPANAMINAMIFMISCDPDFKHNQDYTNFLKSIEGIESYIIMNIEKNKETNTKKAVIFSTALNILSPKKDYGLNRALLIMELYDKTNQEFLKDEVLSSLEKLIETYPGYAAPHYYLGEYYLDKDIDIAKYHLRRCLDDPSTRDSAAEILDRINNVEEYDRAVELIENGQGYDALKILLPMVEDNPEHLDAKFYAAVALRQTENFHKALIYLNELLEFAERAEVYAEIGINLAELNDFNTAIVYFKNALKIKPDDSGMICNIGVCYLNLNNYEEAKKAFELATRINPKDEIAFEWLEKLNKINQ